MELEEKIKGMELELKLKKEEIDFLNQNELLLKEKTEKFKVFLEQKTLDFKQQMIQEIIDKDEMIKKITIQYKLLKYKVLEYEKQINDFNSKSN